MFVKVDSPWVKNKNSPSDREKAIAININNGNTIYIREYPKEYEYRFTVELEVTVGIEVWQNRIIASFDTVENANLYLSELMDAYGKGIKVSDINEKRIPYPFEKQ